MPAAAAAVSTPSAALCRGRWKSPKTSAAKRLAYAAGLRCGGPGGGFSGAGAASPIQFARARMFSFRVVERVGPSATIRFTRSHPGPGCWLFAGGAGRTTIFADADGCLRSADRRPAAPGARVAARPRRVPAQGPPRRRAVRGQVQEPARPRGDLLPGRPGPEPRHQDGGAGEQGGRLRGDRDAQRVRGAAAGEHPHQGPQAALQHQPQGRQVVPGDPAYQRAVSEGVPHPHHRPGRLRVLRAVPEGEPDRHLPDADRQAVPAAQARQRVQGARSAMPELSHRAVRGAVRGQDRRRGVPGAGGRGAQAAHRQERRPAARAAHPHGGGGEGAALREGGGVPRPGARHQRGDRQRPERGGLLARGARLRGISPRRLLLHGGAVPVPARATGRQGTVPAGRRGAAGGGAAELSAAVLRRRADPPAHRVPAPAGGGGGGTAECP